MELIGLGVGEGLGVESGSLVHTGQTQGGSVGNSVQLVVVVVADAAVVVVLLVIGVDDVDVVAAVVAAVDGVVDTWFGDDW